jgi:ubiquinone/menaquinone biosynthesis C-methylase UbiE
MAIMVSAISYGPGVPDEGDLRLCGDVAGKRVIELGGTANAIAFSERGARSLATATAAQIEEGRERAEQAEVHVEFHSGDLADLGFATSGSVDLVFSCGALADVDDLPRVLRQAHRVLKPEASLVFSVPHPMAAMLEGGEIVLRRGYGTGARTMSDYFMAVMRAGFRVDVMAEPHAVGQPAALVPAALVMRAKKLGV